jgi:hypothetical protein
VLGYLHAGGYDWLVRCLVVWEGRKSAKVEVFVKFRRREGWIEASSAEKVGCWLTISGMRRVVTSGFGVLPLSFSDGGFEGSLSPLTCFLLFF